MEPLSILLFIILFLLSGFFSWSEIAFLSLPRHTIDSLVKQKRRGAKLLKKLRENTDRLLITILIGNNLVNTFTASLAAKISIDIAEQSWLEQSLAIGISTWIITFLILVFWEILPKSFATRNAQRISLSIAKVFYILEYIFYPFVILIEWIMKFFQSQWGVKNFVSDEEIESFLEMGEQSWVFEQWEYQKLKSMLSFHDVTAQEVMTPRVHVEALSNQLSVNDAVNEALQFSHSRIPVYNQSIDTIDHIVSLRELLHFQHTGNGKMKLHDVCNTDIIKVPITKPIHSLLELFRKTRQHIGIVIDEYWNMAGVITLEDVVEEVFGDIQDETDVEKPWIIQQWNRLIVQSFIMFDDVLERLWIDFDTTGLSWDAYTWETIGYFIIDFLWRFPQAEEILTIQLQYETDDESDLLSQLQIQVLSVKKNTIQECKVWLTT